MANASAIPTGLRPTVKAVADQLVQIEVTADRAAVAGFRALGGGWGGDGA